MSAPAADVRLVEELLAVEGGLSAWELDFAESLGTRVLEQGRPLSDGQRVKAEEILRWVEGA